MPINSFERAGMFELTGELDIGPQSRIFKAINPYFFNFFKQTSDPEEQVEALPGITIEWSSERRQPLVKLEAFAINQEAQLFYQLYEDQMVEMAT